MIGKLVRINRASIGVPKGTLGLVTRELKGAVSYLEGGTMVPHIIYEVLLCGKKCERRFLVQDLEVIEVVNV